MLKKFFKTKSHFHYNHTTSQNKGYEFSIYCPHPFTNWSLNPAHKTINGNEHTLEGFRKTSHHDSIREILLDRKNSFVIYCVGGSTTYCTEIDSYKKSWPYLLQEKLVKLTAKKIIVINAGVGGWGTLQSSIRYSVWGEIIKPDLTIIYQSKNDLTPFYNGRSSEADVLPMYENIMLQFAAEVGASERAYRLCNGGIAAVYSSDINPSEQGLTRFNDEDLMLTKSRYDYFMTLSARYRGKTLFIPELIMKDSAYYPFMQKLHSAMKEVSSLSSESEFLDFRDIFPMVGSNFLDKMHFSPNGCNEFSDLLTNAINKMVKF